jgi:hypothetical protein
LLHDANAPIVRSVNAVIEKNLFIILTVLCKFSKNNQ